MNIDEFSNYHLPALELDEVRFNVLIPVIMREKNGLTAGLQFWTLGGPGHCAAKAPGRAILLGALDRGECERLALETKDLAYEGVLGSDSTAGWFAEHAGAHGIAFDQKMPQRIHTLTEQPRYPGAEGSPRTVVADDAPLLFEWMLEFHREAVPHDPLAQPAKVEKDAAGGQYLFWTVDGEPVSVAAIVRRLPAVAAIAAVYTPPDKRGRGYAGSVTAALCERIFGEGKRAACLYTNLNNPYSNRCYAKIGFKPYCDSWHYVRRLEASCPKIGKPEPLLFSSVLDAGRRQASPIVQVRTHGRRGDRYECD